MQGKIDATRQHEHHGDDLDRQAVEVRKACVVIRKSTGRNGRIRVSDGIKTDIPASQNANAQASVNNE